MDINLHTFFFYLIAILTGICAVGVVVTRNIVRSAAWLLFTLAGTAGIFFLLNADFVGATQLLIYVGGTLVLVVFGVMLTAQGPFISMKTGAAEWVISTSAGLLLFAVLAVTTGMAFQTPRAEPTPDEPATARASMEIGQALLAVPPASGTGKASSPPTTYLLPFEII